jgi:hypothetical protein
MMQKKATLTNSDNWMNFIDIKHKNCYIVAPICGKIKFKSFSHSLLITFKVFFHRQSIIDEISFPIFKKSNWMKLPK